MSRDQLDRVDDNLIKTALKRMKSNKRDAIFDTVSDCYINGPPKLVSHMTRSVKMFLTMGLFPTLYSSVLCSPL